MTVDPNSIDLPAFIAEHLQRAEPDLLRSMLSTFVQALMSAEADAICGAGYGGRRPERTRRRAVAASVTPLGGQGMVWGTTKSQGAARSPSRSSSSRSSEHM